MQGERTDTPARATSGRVTLTCDEVLDLSAAESLRAQLLAALASGEDLEIQAAAVRQIDTANLQLLCAAALDLRARERNLIIVEPSSALLQAARRLGLSGVLGLDAALAAAAPVVPAAS
jgi:anti-anti-sigma regulatory factor